MKFLIATSVASMFSFATADLFNAWDILPPKEDWRAIMKSFDSSDDIKSYVDVYVAPFKQLQDATRNNNVSPDTIKTSMLSLLDLVQQSCKNFSITSEVFNSRKRDEFRKVLDSATKIFSTPNAEHLEPVFKKTAVHQFMHQRFDDMLVAAKDQKDVLARVKKFYNYAKHRHSQIKGWKPIKFKFIIPRNLDLNVVAQYSTSVIKNRKDKGFKKKDGIDKMYWKLHTLGNDARSSNPFNKTWVLGAILLGLLAYV